MLKFKTRIRMGKKGEFNYFKCMMVAGPGWGGVRIQGKKKTKYQVRRSSLDDKIPC